MAVIEIDKLTKDYGNKKGIFDVSFSVNRGEVVGFLGSNGAGKTNRISWSISVQTIICTHVTQW